MAACLTINISTLLGIQRSGAMSLSETTMPVDSACENGTLACRGRRILSVARHVGRTSTSELVLFIFSFVYPTTSKLFITARTKRKLTLLHGLNSEPSAKSCKKKVSRSGKILEGHSLMEDSLTCETTFFLTKFVLDDPDTGRP